MKVVFLEKHSKITLQVGKKGHKLLCVLDFIVLFSTTFGKLCIIQRFGLIKTSVNEKKAVRGPAGAQSLKVFHHNRLEKTEPEVIQLWRWNCPAA